MVGSDDCFLLFPFGMAYFQGWTVSFREGTAAMAVRLWTKQTFNIFWSSKEGFHVLIEHQVAKDGNVSDLLDTHFHNWWQVSGHTKLFTQKLEPCIVAVSMCCPWSIYIYNLYIYITNCILSAPRFLMHYEDVMQYWCSLSRKLSSLNTWRFKIGENSVLVVDNNSL